MLAKRIIPCLDIKDGRVVKGVKFLGLKDAGDPVSVAKLYDNQQADELVFLDIRMLGMSGLDVLKEIKAYDKSIKVVMLSVANDTFTKSKALAFSIRQTMSAACSRQNIRGLSSRRSLPASMASASMDCRKRRRN